jgi:cytochrome c-type biogenesis protein
MLERLPVAFIAGFLSIVFPCVLPLVPGYLSAVSAVDVDQLGERSATRRVVLASLPFILGFTVVFVVLGAGAAAIGSAIAPRQQRELAGFVLVVLGLAFMGLVPWPKRFFAPDVVQRAHSSGSNVLLGGAFAVCAAPCIGTVLGSILVLASTSGTVVRGVVLLVAYSLGLGAAFLLAGVAFASTMGTLRWFRDHYAAIQMASGAVLVALGLLLFFDRDWWLRVFLNRALSKIGLGEI